MACAAILNVTKFKYCFLMVESYDVYIKLLVIYTNSLVLHVMSSVECHGVERLMSNSL